MLTRLMVHGEEGGGVGGCCSILALFPSIIKKKRMFLVVLPKYFGEFEKKMHFELEVR